MASAWATAGLTPGELWAWEDAVTAPGSGKGGSGVSKTGCMCLKQKEHSSSLLLSSSSMSPWEQLSGFYGKASRLG